MLYNLIRVLFYFIFLLYSLFRPKNFRFISERVFQDLSNIKNGKDYIWIHCSSVGEINLVDSFVRQLLKKKDENILITTFTDTGFEIAKIKYSNEKKIDILKFPLDDYFLIKRILKRIDLKRLIIVETEIWLNLINLVSKRAEIYLINGRISDKSFSKYRKIKFLLAPILKKITLFCMQSERDLNNICELGADRERCFVTGNLKFDIDFERYTETERKNLRNLINPTKKNIFVVGSSRAGEEKIFLEILDKIDNLLLVFVPRHLERVGEIVNLLNENRISFQKYSEILKNNKSSQFNKVIIVDSMGVLRQFYDIADYCFVGGTMVNIGGHNLLEPLYYGKAVMFGSYLQNVRDISREILNLNVGFKVEKVDDIVKLINDGVLSSVSSERITDFFLKNKNAVKKTLDIMEERCKKK